LIGCSVALFIKGLIVHNRLLNMKRDTIDSRLFSQWIASIHKTAGGQQGEERYFVVQLAEPPARKPDDNNGGESATLPEQQPASDTAVIADDRVSFNCRKCKTEFHVPLKYSGKRGKCKKCGAVMVVAVA
jgi:hypothetical protein